MPPKASQVSMHWTRPSNANAHPGRPILEAEAEEQLQNAKRKPWIEDGMEALEAKGRESNTKPIRPCPRPTGKGNKVSIKDTASEDALLSDSEIDEVAGKSGKTKKQQKMTLLKEAIRNAHSGSKADDIDALGAHAISNNKGNNVVLLWANDVSQQAHPKSNTSSSKSDTYCASQAASTPPSSVLSTTSTNTSSQIKSAAIDKKQPTKLNIFPKSTDDVLMVSDDSLDGSDVLEWQPVAPQKKVRQAVRKSTVIVPASESDSELEQATYFAESSGVKHKANDVTDFVDETASEATDDSDVLIDDLQEMTSLLSETIIDSESKQYAPHKTTSVCVSFISRVTDSARIFEASSIVSQSATPPPSKKLKKERSRASKVANDNDLIPPPSTQVPTVYYNDVVPPPSTQVPTGYYDDVVPPPSTQVPSNAGKTAVQEAIKLRGQYHNNDLPIPADSKWVKAFLSTMLLWAGSQPNPWEIPESAMADALQEIFNVAYPDVKYKVNTNGAVFTVAQQQLSEWRSNIGSTALAIIIDFCLRIMDAPNTDIAKQLLQNYTFMYEDLDNISWDTAYLSAFLLRMIASTHLSAIIDHADVPMLHTDKLALGKGMDGVIVLCVVALERALKFIKDKVIKVEDVLTSMTTGKSGVKLPKTLNKMTGKMLSGVKE
ncbi:hypothetical protein F4604DRAFT_1927890 [Suillus subluteus]|nr:hypothetical protein F4604DRAFT_1927890 [Suillus subluteus]